MRVLIILVLIVVLSGCGSGSSPSTEEPEFNLKVIELLAQYEGQCLSIGPEYAYQVVYPRGSAIISWAAGVDEISVLRVPYTVPAEVTTLHRLHEVMNEMSEL